MKEQEQEKMREVLDALSSLQYVPHVISFLCHESTIRVWNVLKSRDIVTVNQVMSITGLSYHNAYRILEKLMKLGLITKAQVITTARHNVYSLKKKTQFELVASQIIPDFENMMKKDHGAKLSKWLRDCKIKATGGWSYSDYERIVRESKSLQDDEKEFLLLTFREIRKKLNKPLEMRRI